MHGVQRSNQDRVETIHSQDFIQVLQGLAGFNLDGDEDFLKSVLKGFVGHAKGQFSRIEQAMQAEDAEAVRKEAHAIKGGAANLLANPLATAAKELEELASAEQIADFPGSFDRLNLEFSRLLQELNDNQQLSI